MPLNAEAQAFIDELASLELPPFETLDAETQRAMLDQPRQDAPDPEPIHHTEDRTLPGPAGELPIRVYKPSDADDLPVIVYFHGGGWVLGGLDSHDALCRALANRCSVALVAVAYRLAPEHPYPAGFDDCLAALRWVADNGEELGVDTNRLAVAGDSAGGNLAAAVVVAANAGGGPDLAAQILIYPATNLVEPDTDSFHANGEGYLLTKGWMNWFIEQYLPDVDRRRDPEASPALVESHAGLPPTIVITAEYDPLCDDGRNYAATLEAAGVDVVYREFDSTIHGFVSQLLVLSDGQRAVQGVADFLATRW